MENFFVSSFEKHQLIDGKESRIKGKNQNGHVTMEGEIEGKKFVYDNKPHKVFRKTPYPISRRRRKAVGMKRKTFRNMKRKTRFSK